MEFTVDKLKENLSKMISDIPPKDHVYSLVNTKETWKILRDRGGCDPFTDEELDSGNNPFKRGWVAGCGVVDMWCDLYYENADNIATMDRLNTKFELEFTGEYKT